MIRRVLIQLRLIAPFLVFPVGSLFASDVCAHQLKLLPKKHGSVRADDERAPARGSTAAPDRIRGHSHLQIGDPPTPLFDRRDLEVRPSALRSTGPDTTVIKIAVIRVEFETDRLGDLTTGNGRFMRVNPDPEEIFIDPAPHNAAYFKSHLEAVNRYWSSMTYGCVRVEGEVFPRDQEFGAYRLPDMADYGPENEDEFFSIPGLIAYSQESLLAADADSQLVWSDWDVHFVVHAGSDWQNDVLRDSPFDLPTFSIGFSDSEAVVTDEGDTLRSMITYPETSSQDGFLVALNGGIAHEMGHQLGLFDLYNVDTFASTVAFYDIMDSGNLASVDIPNPNDPTNPDRVREVIGVLPTAVGAWSRWFITQRFGIEPTEIKRDAPRMRLRAIQSRVSSLPPNTSKWYKLPLSETEYFLVENRVDDLDGRDSQGFNTVLDADSTTGVVLGPIRADDNAISHNYDYLVNPGVLIWHIDERQALANLRAGRGLNVFFDKRSITIEEADGIVDIGFSPFFPVGTDKETFHADNNANFTPTTRPNSDSNLGIPSYISITNIGPLDSTIAMNFSFSAKPPGWPMEVGRYGTSGRTSTTAADIDNDGFAEIALSADSTAYVFEYEDVDGDGQVDPAGIWPQPAAAARLFGNPSYTQAIGDFDGDRALEIVAVTDSGAVYLWRADGSPYGSSDSTGALLRFAPEDAPAWSAVPADLDKDGTDELYLTTLDGRLRGYDVSGGSAVELFSPRPLLGAQADSVDTLYSTLAFGDITGDGIPEGIVLWEHDDTVTFQRFARDGRRTPRVSYELPGGSEGSSVRVGLADVDRSGDVAGLEIFLAHESGWVNLVDAEGTPLPGWPTMFDPPILSPPAFGDLDQDGLLEIALTSGENSVHALNYNATEMPGWPIVPELADHPDFDDPAPGPAIADVDGDGRLDVVVGMPDFTVRAYAPDGTEANGFPIVAGAAVTTTPAILDANGDGRLDLFVQAFDGHVYARILAGVASRTNPAWGMFMGGPKLNGSFDAGRMPTLAVSSGQILAGPVRIYPNPISGDVDRFTVRYTLAAGLANATKVEVRLYNLAGEEVESVEGPTFANTENTVFLRTRDFASGVYFCSLRARSGDREETHMGKFAVIR